MFFLLVHHADGKRVELSTGEFNLGIFKRRMNILGECVKIDFIHHGFPSGKLQSFSIKNTRRTFTAEERPVLCWYNFHIVGVPTTSLSNSKVFFIIFADNANICNRQNNTELVKISREPLLYDDTDIYRNPGILVTIGKLLTAPLYGAIYMLWRLCL